MSKDNQKVDEKSTNVLDDVEYARYQKMLAKERKWRLYDLTYRIRREMVYKLAEDAGITVTDAEVQAEIDKRIAAGTLKPIK